MWWWCSNQKPVLITKSKKKILRSEKKILLFNFPAAFLLIVVLWSLTLTPRTQWACLARYIQKKSVSKEEENHYRVFPDYNLHFSNPISICLSEMVVFLFLNLYAYTHRTIFLCVASFYFHFRKKIRATFFAFFSFGTMYRNM